MAAVTVKVMVPVPFQFHAELVEALNVTVPELLSSALLQVKPVRGSNPVASSPVTGVGLAIQVVLQLVVCVTGAP